MTDRTNELILPEKLNLELDRILNEDIDYGQKKNSGRRKIKIPSFRPAQVFDNLPPDIEKKLDNFILEVTVKKPELPEEARFGSGIIGAVGSFVIPYRFYKAMTNPPPEVIIDTFVRLVVDYCLGSETMVLVGGSKVITVKAFLNYLVLINKNYTPKQLVKIFAALKPECIEETFYIGGPFGKQLKDFSEALEEKFGIDAANLETIVFWLQGELKKYYEEQKEREGKKWGRINPGPNPIYPKY